MKLIGSGIAIEKVFKKLRKLYMILRRGRHLRLQVLRENIVSLGLEGCLRKKYNREVSRKKVLWGSYMRIFSFSRVVNMFSLKTCFSTESPKRLMAA